MTLPMFPRPNNLAIDADDRSIAILPRFKKHEIFAILRDYHAAYDAAYTQPSVEPVAQVAPELPPERTPEPASESVLELATVPDWVEESTASLSETDLTGLAEAIDEVMDNLLASSADRCVPVAEAEPDDLINVLNDSVCELQSLMRSLDSDDSTEAQQLFDLLNAFTADLKNVVRHLLDLRLVSSMTMDWMNDDYPEFSSQDAATLVLDPTFDDEDETMFDLDYSDRAHSLFGMDAIETDATLFEIEELKDDSEDCDVQRLVSALLEGRETVNHSLPDDTEANFWEELERLLDDDTTTESEPSSPAYVNSLAHAWTLRFVNETSDEVSDVPETLETPEMTDDLLDAIAVSYHNKTVHPL